MSAVTAREFAEAFESAWKRAYEGRRSEIEEAYNNRRLWTELMCGSESPLSPDRVPLIKAAMESLQHFGKSILFDRERHKVDAFGRVLIGAKHTNYTDCVNVVMVEVENDVERAEEEMWKLLHSRCPLKILVTYDYNDRKIREHKVATFAQMYRGMEPFLGVDPAEYLLIIGGRVDDSRGAEIVWRYWEMKAGRMQPLELSAAKPVAADTLT